MSDITEVANATGIHLRTCTRLAHLLNCKKPGRDFILEAIDVLLISEFKDLVARGADPRLAKIQIAGKKKRFTNQEETK